MKVIEKKNLENLTKELAKKFSVVAPVRREDGEYVFSKLGEDSSPDFNYRPTVLSIKQFFFPAKEETFAFDTKKKKVLPQARPEKIVLFGLNLRDTEALVQLDEIMKKPKPDYFYFQKRNLATVVSIINVTDSLPHVGVDLILEKVNDKEYKATPLTKEGRKILESRYFKNTKKIKIKVNPKSKKMAKLRELLLDPELLKDAVEWSWEGIPEIWDDLAKQCLGCGICTYVCPLCHCFSVEDRCALSGEKCTKTREWDACTLPGFAQITGGHNFHRTIKERYYNWFFHKFVRAYKEFGKSQCVACGRCAMYCPARIDIEKVLVDIVKKYQSKVKF